MGTAPAWPMLAAVASATVYALMLLASESQVMILGLVLVGALGALAVARTSLAGRLTRSAADRPRLLRGAMLSALLLLCLFFHDDNFVLFLVATVLINVITCLGLNIQFGLAGVVNFAGASFFGVGCYAAAVLTKVAWLPHPVIILLAGLLAALIGSLLLIPVVKTRGHYAALVTIAFALLLKTFLEVNDALGGPQGMKCSSLRVLGLDFNQSPSLAGVEGSFYLNYIAVLLILTLVGFILARRLEESWIGLNMDAIRLDETAAACFGVNIPRWKITAFTLGNFYAGVAGSLYAMMTGFIAPPNFTFGDSLILVSIVLLGGVGSSWGVVAASAIVILLPEKLQVLQEYRFLLFSVLVILILLFKPEGLVPRPLRGYLDSRGRREIAS